MISTMLRLAAGFTRRGTATPPDFKEGVVFIESQSANPAVHALCIKIAQRCVRVIQACLREEERIEAVREFYRVCREEIDKPPGRDEEV